jgi:capsular exopolysaccharide synthesis family protein
LRGRGVYPPDHVVAHPFSAFSEAFRSLAASIAHRHGAGPVRTVAVTSALPGEGKTTTAICLARTAALQGRQVIIVDTDIQRRRFNASTNRPDRAGLLEVLSGEASLEDVLVRDNLTEADILPVGGAPAPRADVCGSPAMEHLLRGLKSRYDLVVLDTAPVNAVADGRVLAKRADFVVLVAGWRATPYPAVKAALRLLSDHGANVDGILLNRMDLKRQRRHAYGDASYYYREYKHYYLDADVSREAARGAAG